MLELKNVTKIFNLTGSEEDERIALDNVSLKINSGDFVTVIGGNGSGKSTSLNIISGVLKPDSGQVLLNGVDITNKNEYQRAAYFGRVFQDPMMGTASDMSVLENLEVAFCRGKNHSPIKWGFKKSHKDLFIEELKRFNLGLENRLGQKVGVLSGGQRQALTLLMATLRDTPSIKAMIRDYVTFSEKDHDIAYKEITEDIASYRIELNQKIKNIKTDKTLKNKRLLIKQQKYEYYQKIVAKYDLGKQILLLDEHTAALDPNTAKKVLDLTNKIVKENNMTTLMITHNMRDAILYGNRLIMFYGGHIVMDVCGEEKKKLTSADLLKKFDELDAMQYKNN